MDAEQLLAPEGGAPLGRSRADVLDMLQAAGGQYRLCLRQCPFRRWPSITGTSSAHCTWD